MEAVSEQNPSKNETGCASGSLRKADRSPAAALRHRLRVRNYRAEALRRLGVSEDQVTSLPDISSPLKECKGGIKAAIQALRFSSDPVAQAFLKKYDSLAAASARQVPLEAIAISAGVDLAHLLGAFVLALREHSMMRVSIIHITNHPEVAKARVRYALKPGGVKDRDAIDVSLGLMPKSDRGTGFIGPVIINKAEGEEEEVETDLSKIFPDLSEMQKKLAGIRDQRR